MGREESLRGGWPMTRSAGNRQLRDKRPTVLVVGPVAPGDGGLAPGGVSQHVSGLIRALHSSGWRVVVYADDTPQGSGRPRDMEWGTLFGPVRLRMAPLVAGATRGGLHTIMRAWADRHRSARMGSRTRTVIAHSVGLAHAYSHARPDVVHYQHADLRPYWGMLAGIDAPEVITAHSLSAFRDFEDEVLHATVEAALRRADAVIAVSGDTSRALRARIPDLAAPVVIGNGIDVSLFQQGPMPPDDVTGPVVLYQGRIARQKGIPELIRAFATVRQAVPDATLVLVGQEEDVDVAALMSDVGLDSSSVRATGYLEALTLPRGCAGPTWLFCLHWCARGSHARSWRRWPRVDPLWRPALERSRVCSVTVSMACWSKRATLVRWPRASGGCSCHPRSLTALVRQLKGRASSSTALWSRATSSASTAQRSRPTPAGQPRLIMRTASRRSRPNSLRCRPPKATSRIR